MNDFLNKFIDVSNISNLIVNWLVLIVAILLLIGIILKRSVITDFIRTTLAELKKVEWTTKRHVLNYSIASVLFIVFVTGIVFGLDQLFTTLRSILIF